MPLASPRKTRKVFSGHTFRRSNTLEVSPIGLATTIWPLRSNWSLTKPRSGVAHARKRVHSPRFAVTTCLNRISVHQPREMRKEGSRDRWATQDAILWFRSQTQPVLKTSTDKYWNAASKKTLERSLAKHRPLE